MSAQGQRLLSWHDPIELRRSLMEMDGLSGLRALRDGVLPPPPMISTMNLELVEVDPGVVVFRCNPGPEHYNPLGTVHGGLACTALDTAVGCAAHTTLAAGQGYTSIDLTVSYLRPIVLETGPLTVSGTVTRAGRRVIFADGTITDAAGSLFARATSSLLVL